MTDRLTDDEIKALRELSAAATNGPWEHDGTKSPFWIKSRNEGYLVLAECDVAVMDYDDILLTTAMRNAIDRLLDEIEDHRRFRKTLGSIIIDEVAEPISSEKLAKAEAKLKSITDAQN